MVIADRKTFPEHVTENRFLFLFLLCFLNKKPQLFSEDKKSSKHETKIFNFNFAEILKNIKG